MGSQFWDRIKSSVRFSQTIKSNLLQNMKILALFVFNAITVISSGSKKLKTYLPINEKGLHYNQTIEYNFDSDIIIYEVPAHHDILATKTIIHNPSNTMLTKDIKNQLCQLKQVTKGFDPQLVFLHASSIQAGNEEITENDAKEVFMIEVPLGQISPERRGQLPTEMQELCDGLKIDLVESVEVTKDEYEQENVITVNMREESLRVKRESIWATCDVKQRCHTGAIGRHYCTWITISMTTGNSRVTIDHIRSGHYKCISCCNERKQGHMYKCSNIDDSNFARIQNELCGIRRCCG